jgi:hypothetical protein
MHHTVYELLITIVRIDETESQEDFILCIYETKRLPFFYVGVKCGQCLLGKSMKYKSWKTKCSEKYVVL